MANLALVRVDNRLIHGQVATGFIGKLGVGKIVVIDDKTATNEFARDVLALAVPPGVTLEVYTAAQAAEVWKKDQFGTGTVMVPTSDTGGQSAELRMASSRMPVNSAIVCSVAIVIRRCFSLFPVKMRIR